MNSHHFKTGKTLSSALALIVLSACSSDNSTDPVTCETANATEAPSVEESPLFAFASTEASDFSSGRLERLSVGEFPELTGCTIAGSSDIFVRTDGTNVFALGRGNQDWFAQFDKETLDNVYQYSVVANGASSANPHDVAFRNANQAFIARYDTSSVWIVNPSATSEAEFFLSEIDLSAYDADGATEMTALAIVGDNLFVLMQRLENFFATRTSYIAVFDISGDTPTEVETGMGSDGLGGIQLPVNNAQQMFVNEATGDLIIAANGDAFNPAIAAEEKLSGGVVAVDTTDYSVELLIDDNELLAEPAEGEELTPEFISRVLMVSPEKGYLVSFTSFGTSFVRSFNPTTGLVAQDPLSDFNGVDVKSLNLAPSGNVWVAIGDIEAPGFDRLNPTDDTLVGPRVRTELNPNNVVFITR